MYQVSVLQFDRQQKRVRVRTFADKTRYATADFEMYELSAQQEFEISYDKVEVEYSQLDAMEGREFEAMDSASELRWW